jgi:hypothetical protein
MGKGVIYKYNGSAESKTICNRYNGVTQFVGKIQHSNGVDWFDNYPMEEYITKTFTAQWSQGWLGSGTRLDDGVWKGNILVGSTTGYRGMLGFDKNAIQAHLGPNKFGNVTSAYLWINCYETTTNGAPDIQIGKHSYGSEPAGTWTGQNADWGDLSSLHIPNGGVGGYMITLKPTQLTLADGYTAIGGFAFRAEANTNENHGKLNGVSSYTSRLQITVLK